MPVGQNPFGNIIQHPRSDSATTQLPPPPAAEYSPPAAETPPAIDSPAVVDPSQAGWPSSRVG